MTVSKAPLPRRGRHRGLCTAITEDGSECQQPVAPEAPTTFCTMHGLLTAQWMIGHHRDLVQRVLDAEVQEERTRQEDARGRVRGPNFDHYLKPAVVYYIRFSGSIKIGTTTNLPQRMQTLPMEELLAVEPGGYNIERKRHAEFRSARVQREWFRPTPPLLLLIATLRRQHGDPMAYWERMTRRESGVA